jgi:hypothetical protein
MIHSHSFDAQQATPASLTGVVLSEAKACPEHAEETCSLPAAPQL